MADKDKYADEMLTDDELDGVTGGTTDETGRDAIELCRRGLLNYDKPVELSKVSEKMHELGYTGYKYFNNSIDKNIYSDRNGNTITSAQFWEKFDDENGTMVIHD